jgi:hypothetical protein
VAYVGLWSPESWGPTTGRVLAVDARTGTVRRALRLAGAPAQLVLAPEPAGSGGPGRRLYSVEVAPGSENPHLDRTDPAYAADDRWRVHALDPVTLTPEGSWPLPPEVAPLWLAIAPDGAQAYLLSNRPGPPSRAALTRLDLATGAVDRLASEVPWR